MKKVLFSLVVAMLFTVSVWAYGSYCAGWKIGYKAGYCYGKNYCISPIVPFCPIEPIGRHTWNDGWEDGFVEGMNNQ